MSISIFARSTALRRFAAVLQQIDSLPDEVNSMLRLQNRENKSLKHVLSTPGERRTSPFRFAMLRACASLLDNIFTGALQSAAVALCIYSYSKAVTTSSIELDFGLIILCTTVCGIIALLYHALLESSIQQSTIGQRNFGFTIATAGKSSLSRSLRRNCWRVIFSALPGACLISLCAKLTPIPSMLLMLWALAIIDVMFAPVGTDTPKDWSMTTAPIFHPPATDSTTIATATNSTTATELRISTARGLVKATMYPTAGHCAVVAIGGWGTKRSSPAKGLYHWLGANLRDHNVTTLWLQVRKPGHMEECIHDVRAAIQHLLSNGFSQIVLIGHSFGGAVVISAASFEPRVSAVITLASQNANTANLALLAPRPVLIVHGRNDRVVPSFCADDLYSRAQGNKQLHFVEGGHAMEDSAQDLRAILMQWMKTQLSNFII